MFWNVASIVSFSPGSFVCCTENTTFELKLATPLQVVLCSFNIFFWSSQVNIAAYFIEIYLTDHRRLKYTKEQSQRMTFTQSPSLSNKPKILKNYLIYLFTNILPSHAFRLQKNLQHVEIICSLSQLLFPCLTEYCSSFSNSRSRLSFSHSLSHSSFLHSISHSSFAHSLSYPSVSNSLLH